MTCESPSTIEQTTRPSQLMTEELNGFRARVRRFLEDDFLPRQAEWELQRRPDAEAWTRAGDAGLLLPDVPKEYGGYGGTIAHEAAIVEELARVDVQFGFMIQSVVARYILAYGNEAQKRNWLPRLSRGELVGAIAMTEACAGSDLQGIKTTACRDGQEYVINGSKTFISNGWHASLVALVAKTDSVASAQQGVSIIMVEPKKQPGYRVSAPFDKVGMQEQDTCELVFENVRVPASSLLGASEGRGFLQMMSQLPYERLLVAVSAIATAERALALTMQYAKDRIAFGKPLVEFQNTRFKLAERITEARVGRVFIDHCIERFIAGDLDAVTAAMAKYWLTDCESRILDDCLQLHGGYGYMKAHPIARMWTGSRVHRIYAGTNEIMKEIIATSL